MADNYRLPKDAVPTHYNIAIKTDLDSAPPSYSGEVIITLDVKNDTTSLVFNLDPSLRVTNILVGSGKGIEATPIPVSALTIDKDQQRGHLNLGDASLAAGAEAKLFISWEADIGTNMTGTTSARVMWMPKRASVHSKYDITMIARGHHTVLANMPVSKAERWVPTGKLDSVFSSSYHIGSSLTGEGEWIVTDFEQTPLISTYLVAFACGEFAYLDSEHHSKLTGKTIPLRTYVTPNQVEKVRFATDVMKLALPVYEELFDIAYPLPKLDTLVAHDFDFGAMENWGLITGRTTAYLVDDKSSLPAKKRVGSIQCHEIAHMWFGDIVTMKWWDNLWLNEAFATLMGSIVLPDRIFPDWKMGTEFLNDHWVRALNLDARRTSHPIEVECPDSSMINSIFDAISYSKGASVLRMLKGVVGDDKFFKGVSIYLKKHLYGSAETADLWAGLSEAVGKDIGTMMADWTLKVGFPVITVEEYGGNLKLTQNRFLATGDVKADEDETLWYVPLEIKTISDGKATVDHDAVLSSRSTMYQIASDSFKINADTIGVYRVAYSPERLIKLGQQAQSFSIEDRLGLVSDAAALASAGYAKTSGSLNLVVELSKTETEYLPFRQVAGFLSSIVCVWWENDRIRNAINGIRAKLFRAVVDKVGYEHKETDTPDEKELRALAVAAAANGGDAGVIKELKARFVPFLEANDDSRITPDLQRVIFSKAVEDGSVAEYEKVLEVYDTPPNPSTQVDAMYALCAAKEEGLIERTFAMVADPKRVKDQNLYIFLSALAANRATRRRAGNFLMENWDMLNERFSASFGLRNCFSGALGVLSSRADLERVKDWVAANNVKKYTAIIDQTVEGIEADVKWLERDTGDIEAWLEVHEA